VDLYAVHLIGTGRADPALPNVVLYSSYVPLVWRSVAAASAGVPDDRLAGLQRHVRVGAEFIRARAVAVDLSLRRGLSGQTATHTHGSVVRAVAEIDDVERAPGNRAEHDSCAR